MTSQKIIYMLLIKGQIVFNNRHDNYKNIKTINEICEYPEELI